MDGRANLTLAQQALLLRQEGWTVRLDPAQLVAIGRIQPSELSRTYLVQLVYSDRRQPQVTVLDNQMNAFDSPSPPHVYSRDAKGRHRLCLHADKWNRSWLIRDTVVPWTALWLLFYELWLATGDWHGGGAPVAPANSPSPGTVARRRLLR